MVVIGTTYELIGYKILTAEKVFVTELKNKEKHTTKRKQKEEKEKSEST